MRIPLLLAFLALTLPSSAFADQYVVPLDQAQGEIVRTIPQLDMAVVHSPTEGAVLDPPVALASAPNDPQWINQYGPIAANFDWVWPWHSGAGQTIAIIDTGVNTANLEFLGRVVPGYDFVNNDSDPADDHGHGTRVAGIALAATNNGYLIAGAAPGATLMPIKSIGSDGTGTTSNVVAGIVWAVDNGADVINLSLGSTSASSADLYGPALQYARDRGVSVVCAAGNNGATPLLYPAQLANCLSVGAHDINGIRWTSSNYGSELDLSAAGVFVRSFNHLGTALSGNGTSFASPHVAAAVAILRARGDSAQAARDQLEASAYDAGDPGWDPYYGHGLLDVAYALEIPDPSLPCPEGTLRNTQGQCAPVTVNAVVDTVTALPNGIRITGSGLHKIGTITARTSSTTSVRYYRPGTSLASRNQGSVDWDSDEITLTGDPKLRGLLLFGLNFAEPNRPVIQYNLTNPYHYPIAPFSPIGSDNTLTITSTDSYRHVTEVGVIANGNWYTYTTLNTTGSKAIAQLWRLDGVLLLKDPRLEGEVTQVTLRGHDGSVMQTWSGALAVN
jgi:hypothetical protein